MFDLFDFNNDGKLDFFEKAAEVMMGCELAGVDPSELEFMDEDERQEIFANVGLDIDDIDDFDFY